SAMMCGTTLVFLYLLSGIAIAQKPSMKVIANSSSFTCHKEFLVVDEDFATFEVEVSGNSPDYIYDEFDGPRFRIQKLITKKGNIIVDHSALICVTFGQNAACVKRDIVDKTYCSCEQLGPYVYRVKTVYKIDPTKGKRQGLQLLWPSIHAPALSVVYHLPEIRDFEVKDQLEILNSHVPHLLSSSNQALASLCFLTVNNSRGQRWSVFVMIRFSPNT
ncbi:hypothetical protein PoB_003041300, partial [Plakobranchus ocellatus]